MRKKVAGVAMTMVMSGVFATVVFAAGWSQDEKGYYYQFDDGSYAKGGAKQIDGNSYMFDGEGYMARGWQFVDAKWCYYDTDSGVRATDWRQIDGTWYYFEPGNNGVMHTSWLDLGKKRYYMDESGVMQIGLFSPTGSSYYYQTDDDGVVKRNTTEEYEDMTVIFDENGIMKYRDDFTKQASGAGGDVWQFVMADDVAKIVNGDNKYMITEHVQEKQDECYDYYVIKVLKAKSSAKAKYLDRWEKKVHRSLDLYLSAEEINSYMSEVKSGSYKKYDDDTRYYGDDYDYDDYDD